MPAILRFLAILAVITSGESAPTEKHRDLPIVNLGYQRHQAISLDFGIYNFSNVRYAAAPVGELRFRPPTPPPPADTCGIDRGDVGRVCPSATPLWETSIAPNFVVDYLFGKQFNGSANISSYLYTPLPLDPRTTEDCLFLDVLTPQHVFDKGGKAPVIVWIYGGGYVNGEKSSADGASLISRSMQNGGQGVVFVAMNYRLGAFGWLAGKEVEKNGAANVGLLDQRFALEWVNQNIHLFGGDPCQVTVMGESAGGGSIQHQIIAYGGQGGPVPFQRAIIQSPGFLPLPLQAQQDTVCQEFLQILGVDSLEEARKLPSSKLIAANAYQVGTKSVYGSFTYGPVVDGTFVPELPGVLLLKGDFHKDVEVMIGHNGDEGLIFTSPITTTEDGIREYIQQALPEVKPNITNYLLDVLYPPIFNGSYGYFDSVSRSALMTSDFAFQCNTDYINRAFQNQTYAYAFTVPPALHGQDVAYSFFNGTRSSSVANDTVAYVMQDYFTSFAASGVPKSSLGPDFPIHGDTARMVNLGQTSMSVMTDPTANARCHWWQTASYM